MLDLLYVGYGEVGPSRAVLQLCHSLIIEVRCRDGRQDEIRLEGKYQVFQLSSCKKLIDVLHNYS